MQIYRELEVSSTSDVAQRRLAEGVQAPFVVVANRQTKGRGTQGADWVSPEGNLYCSVALPNTAMRPTLALEVAVNIAAAIQQQTGLRLTVKWPNDLLFAGKKIGGILVETHIQGQACTGLLVGVGLNVATAPATTVGTTCLRAELAENVAALAEIESAVIAAVLTSANPTDLQAGCAAFGLDPGQPYGDGTKTLFVRGPAKDCAGLELADRMGQISVVKETRSPWRWQLLDSPPFYVFDVGNTATKIGKWNGTAFEWIKREADAMVPADALCFGVSVQPERAAALAKTHTICWLSKRPVRVRFNHYDLSQLGSDRLALIEGARKVLPRDKILAISVGTALTIDVIAATGEHLGGYILPGPALQARALADHTAQLPAIELNQVDATGLQLGKSTTTAIGRGILTTMRLAIAALAERFCCTQIVVTGGDARLLDLKGLPHVVDDSLVLRGIVTMATGGG